MPLANTAARTGAFLEVPFWRDIKYYRLPGLSTRVSSRSHQKEEKCTCVFNFRLKAGCSDGVTDPHGPCSLRARPFPCLVIPMGKRAQVSSV